MDLFEFAFCGSFDSKINGLAEQCSEKWSFGTSGDNVILKNYIKHTFKKLYEDKNRGNYILEKSDYCLLNTGLYSKFYEAIYALFKPNTIADRQQWFLDGFFNEYNLGSLQIDTSILPDRANYFSNPEELVFDTNREIIPQYQHIFGDAENFLRLPEGVRNSSNRQMLFDGALKLAKRMINANYKTAIPQYYKGAIQLLIPICLLSEGVPDLALVISKNCSKQYLGHTCLTLDMAYNNARLIARPDSVWLKP